MKLLMNITEKQKKIRKSIAKVKIRLYNYKCMLDNINYKEIHMKKVLNVKKIIIFLSLIILGFSTTVLATDSVLTTDDNSSAILVSGNEYDNAQTIPTDTNYITGDGSNVVLTDNTVENETNISNGLNEQNVYNEAEEDDDLPQTGIEDYNIGILLVIFVAASIYTFKKLKDYKNV